VQPIRSLERALHDLSNGAGYVFSLADLASILDGKARNAVTMVASRAVKSGILIRPCRGIYLLADAPRNGRELFHIAAKLRAGFFNYISLETALSEAGAISQMPISRVTLISSGPSARIACAPFGTIEFTHTKRDLAALSPRLSYDAECHMLRAPVEVAWEDLRASRRNLHLVDKEAL
jgi:hypothetical protein